MPKIARKKFSNPKFNLTIMGQVFSKIAKNFFVAKTAC